jgi:3-phosphoshikimate 1-carboxyvinyltransferase
MKQLIRAVSGPIHARIAIPGARSITHRALMLAAFADGVSELFDLYINTDTLVFIEALRALGVVVQLDQQSRSCIIAGCMGQFPRQTASVWCNDSGTVARFLLAACASSSGSYQFDGAPGLHEKPIAGLIKTLCSQGAKVSPATAETVPFVLQGADGLKGGEIAVEGAQTSQFFSALLMVAPFSKHEVLLTTRDNISSHYINMTCDVMAEFGVLVRRMHKAFYRVPAPQRYLSRNYFIEPDLSIASYFFAAAAVTAGEIKIQPVSRIASRQVDKEFLTVLEKMGCTVQENVDGLAVQGPAELQGVSVNMKHFSDTFMTLAAIAPFANSPTTITNIGHTRLHETNRISAMRHGLENLGVTVEEGPDWIRIFPSTPHAAEINCKGDPRVAMAFSIIGLKVSGIVIEGADCVNKTCADFYTLWDMLK